MSTSVYERKANAVGLTIKPSKRSGKKFDVFLRSSKEYQTSIGAKQYKDYEVYLREQGKEEAEKRRAAYKARHVHRHTKYRDGKITAAWAADKILW